MNSARILIWPSISPAMPKRPTEWLLMRLIWCGRKAFRKCRLPFPGRRKPARNSNENWFAIAAQEGADRNYSADRHYVLSARFIHAGQLEHDAAGVGEGDLAHGGNSQA